MKSTHVLMSLILLGVMTVTGQAWEGEIWPHPDAQELPTGQRGPFVRPDDGRVPAFGHNEIVVSDDDGRTWTRRPMYQGAENIDDTGGGALFRTSKGVIVHAFLNFAEKNFAWDYEGVGPPPECQLPVYVTRSLDDGETWEEPRKLQEGRCGYVHNMIELDSGRLVHGDFNASNILVRGGRIAAFLDWEFAHVGTRWMDVGNLLREVPPDLREHVRAGMEGGGASLSDDWQARAELVDLSSALEFLTSDRSDAFKHRCVERVRRTVIRVSDA